MQILLPHSLLLLLISLQTSSGEGCLPYTDCPTECLCAMTTGGLRVHCTNGGLTDDSLNLLLKRIPRRVAILHIDGQPESNPNNFSITRDFTTFPQLRELRIRHGSIGSLGKRIFEKMRTLKLLDVSHNRIAFLSHEAFLECDHLEELILDSNRLGINGLPASAFIYLRALKTLSLADNQLSSPAANVFYSLDLLTSLNLDGNPLRNALTEGYFNYMPKLEKLSLQNCKLGTVPANLFQPNTSLISLSIGFNSLETIPGEVLVNLHKLEHLDQSGNYIKNLTYFTFGTTSIKSLNLSFNLLGSYTDSIHPAGFGPLKLETLDLSNNCFRHFTSMIFTSTIRDSLHTLYLSGNPLYRLQPEQTERLWALKHLHLAEIGLEEFPAYFSPIFNQLETLNLSGNSIGYLDPERLESLHQLETLDLSNCELRSFTDSVSQILQNITNLRLHDNLWTCQCGILTVQALLQSHVEFAEPSCPGLWPNYYESSILCASPQRLAGRPLATLALDEIPKCSPVFGAVGITAESEIGILAAAVCSVLLILILASAVACSYFWPKTASFRAKQHAISNGNSNSEQSELVRKVPHTHSTDHLVIKMPQERLF